MGVLAKAIVACLLLVCASNVAVGSDAAPTGTGGRFDNDAEECLEAIPAAQSVSGVTDNGKRIVLDVHLVLDGIPVSRGAEIIQQAQYAYEPLNIDLRATYQEVSFPPQRMAQEFALSGEPVPSSDPAYLFQKTKEAVGGTRPPDSDLVYLLTNDEITGTTAGVADCIGGVRYPTRAFGIGEEDEDTGSGLHFCCTLSTAKVAAHEIAHLMGAHHHYANCVEGAATKLDDPHLGTCTMMFNDVGLVNLRFSVLEGAVVRGHAVKFADRGPAKQTPGDPDPGPSPSEDPEPDEPVNHFRSVDLQLVRHLVARGRVYSGDKETCSASVAVALQRRSGGAWMQIRRGVTAGDGTFRLGLPDEPGRYRVFVDRVEKTTSDGALTCSAAASGPASHRH